MQCRWEHVNRDFSALTEVEALMLDGHFIMEHAGRNWSGRFFNFNGTAGIWRRAAIADAGDWQHDTLTEDMDLSYRAQLRGWKFVYLPDIVAPAELPVEMSAFKSQQFRWAKGSVQVAKKLLPTILRSNATFAQKSEAFFHLTNNLAYPLLLVLSILLLPNLALRTHHGWREVLMIDLPLFFGTTLSVASFYLASQREIALLDNPGVRPRFQWAALQAPAAGDVDRHRPLRQPDARGARGARRPRDGVRAHAQARHPRQARELVQQEVPLGQVHHAVHRARDGRLLRGRDRASRSITATTCRCRSWASSSTASATSAGSRSGRGASGWPCCGQALGRRRATASPWFRRPATPVLQLERRRTCSSAEIVRRRRQPAGAPETARVGPRAAAGPPCAPHRGSTGRAGGTARLGVVAGFSLAAAGACSSSAARMDADGPDASSTSDPRAAVCAEAGASPGYDSMQRIFDENCASCHVGGDRPRPHARAGGLVGEPGGQARAARRVLRRRAGRPWRSGRELPLPEADQPDPLLRDADAGRGVRPACRCPTACSRSCATGSRRARPGPGQTPGWTRG